MGRPRKPTELLELSGAFEKNPNRRRPVGPKSLHPLGPAPKHLSPAQAACWRELAAQAVPGVLTRADRWGVEIAARLMEEIRRHEVKAAKFSLLTRLLGTFGMSPADRARLTLPPDEPDEASAWDQFN